MPPRFSTKHGLKTFSVNAHLNTTHTIFYPILSLLFNNQMNNGMLSLLPRLKSDQQISHCAKSLFTHLLSYLWVETIAGVNWGERERRSCQSLLIGAPTDVLSAKIFTTANKIAPWFVRSRQYLTCLPRGCTGLKSETTPLGFGCFSIWRRDLWFAWHRDHRHEEASGLLWRFARPPSARGEREEFEEWKRQELLSFF